MSSLRQIKEQFERVIIKYTKKSCEVMVVDGLKVYVGSSKCHDNDQFNRKLGRAIALGRAMHAYNVLNNGKNPRNISSLSFADGTSKYNSFSCADTTGVDNLIIGFLPKRESQNAS